MPSAGTKGTGRHSREHIVYFNRDSVWRLGSCPVLLQEWSGQTAIRVTALSVPIDSSGWTTLNGVKQVKADHNMGYFSDARFQASTLEVLHTKVLKVPGAHKEPPSWSKSVVLRSL